MNQHVVIVDYSHCFHRCHSIALGAPNNFDVIDTTVYHFQATLKTLEKSLANLGIISYDLIFAEDRVPRRKLNLLPSYRSNRTNNYASKKLAVKAKLREQGVTGFWVHSEDNEADDVIATLVDMSKTKGLFNVIVTGDRDLWQLMDETVVLFEPKKKVLITPEHVLEAFSVNSSHIALHKALWGDAGDCVPNAIPRTQKHLLPIVRQSDGTYEHFRLLIEGCWNSLPSKYREKLTQSFPQCTINWALVKLDPNCHLTWD